MQNPHLIQRLKGIQTILNGVHQSNASMSSSAKGTERESFIDEFLSKVLPPIYRFGTGDATDANGNKSGQLDVVIEYPFSPSLPITGSGTQRLYLAEGVAAVVEVKSDISSQWEEAIQTANKLQPVKRKFSGVMGMGSVLPTSEIPLFVVAYKGWKRFQTAHRKLAENSNIAGVLIIDPGVFVSSQQYDGLCGTGPSSLWGLICCLHKLTVSLQAASTSPNDYARQ